MLSKIGVTLMLDEFRLGDHGICFGYEINITLHVLAPSSMQGQMHCTRSACAASTATSPSFDDAIYVRPLKFAGYGFSFGKRNTV